MAFSVVASWLPWEGGVSVSCSLILFTSSKNIAFLLTPPRLVPHAIPRHLHRRHQTVHANGWNGEQHCYKRPRGLCCVSTTYRATVRGILSYRRYSQYCRCEKLLGVYDDVSGEREGVPACKCTSSSCSTSFYCMRLLQQSTLEIERWALLYIYLCRRCCLYASMSI